MENNFLKVLFDEHDVIVKAIGIARQARNLIGVDNARFERTISELIRFFRVYADQFHHFKEEEILFPEMAKKNELLGEGVIREMFDNHEDFRELIRQIGTALHAKDYELTTAKLEEYAEALLDHIAVENDELFQTAYSIFDDAELENIFYRFTDLDREIGDARKSELQGMLDALSK